jgi:hypothetical protein
MTVGLVGDSRQVDWGRFRGTILTVDVAREVPSHSSTIIGIGNARVFGRGDDAGTLLVDILEQEAEILSASHVLIHVQGVLRAVKESRYCRMFVCTESVIVSVNDNRVTLDLSTLDPERLNTTDGLSESESNETDNSHEREDDTDDSDFFSPCTLSFRCSFTATTSKCPVGNTNGEEVAVDHPSGLGTGYKVAKAWTTVGFMFARVDFVDLCCGRRSVGLGFSPSQRSSSQESAFVLIGVTTK